VAGCCQPYAQCPALFLIKQVAVYKQTNKKGKLMYLYNYFRSIKAGDFHQFNDFPTASLPQGKRQKRGRKMRENRAAPTQQNWRKNEA